MTKSPLQLTARIVGAYVAQSPVPASDMPTLTRAVHFAVSSPAAGERESRPAVAIDVSVMPDYLVCVEDGKRLKMLKRYLRTRFDVTPGQYRSKWNLTSDYPMTAPNYAARRSNMAKEFGLGRHGAKQGARRTRKT